MAPVKVRGSARWQSALNLSTLAASVVMGAEGGMGVSCAAQLRCVDLPGVSSKRWSGEAPLLERHVLCAPWVHVHVEPQDPEVLHPFPQTCSTLTSGETD